MNQDETFRVVLIVGAALVMPVMIYSRIRAATGEKLDRWQEGAFPLFALRVCGLGAMGGLIAFMINPSSMAWSQAPIG